MEVRAMNKLNAISSLMTKFNIDEKKSTVFNLTSVKNMSEDKSQYIKDTGSLIARLTVKIKDKKNKISNLDSLSKKNGSDSYVRMKSGNFKAGQPDNFVKKLLNGNRYGSERKAAAEYLGVKENSVSVGVAKSKLNSDLDKLTTTLDKNTNNLEDAQTDLEGLKEIGSHLRKIPTKYHPSARTQSNKIKNGGEDEKIEQRRNFSTIYQTNIGCSGLNSHARAIYGKSSVANNPVSPKKVIDEYKKAHGQDIFGKGNKDLKIKIETLSGDIPTLVKTAATAFYTPSTTNIKTTRGQGMTKDGFNSLINGQEKNITYQLGQFFSTSKDTEVAKGFAKNSPDEIKVLFTINGNSSNSLLVQGGLTFGDNEKEKLYSPLAHFKVTDVSKSKEFYNVTLTEQKSAKNAPLLPY